MVKYLVRERRRGYWGQAERAPGCEMIGWLLNFSGSPMSHREVELTLLTFPSHHLSTNAKALGEGFFANCEKKHIQALPVLFHSFWGAVKNCAATLNGGRAKPRLPSPPSPVCRPRGESNIPNPNMNQRRPLWRNLARRAAYSSGETSSEGASPFSNCS